MQQKWKHVNLVIWIASFHLSLNVSHERVDKSREAPHRYPLPLTSTAEVSARVHPELNIKTDINFAQPHNDYTCVSLWSNSPLSVQPKYVNFLLSASDNKQVGTKTYMKQHDSSE